MRRIKKASVASALAALTVTSLLSPAANAVIGQVRSSGDTQLTPTAFNSPPRAKSGPNLVVNPADANQLVELHQELTTEECEVQVSRDGGTTWTSQQNLKAPLTGTPAYPTGRPGPCDVTGHGAANIGQRSLAWGSGNNVYITWTSTRQLGTQGFTVLLSKSTDGGSTFGPTTEIPGMVSGVSPAPTFSKPEIAVDIRSVNTDRLIVAARDATSGDVLVARSEDAGNSWAPVVAASNNNPLTNPPPVYNADSSAIITPGNAFRGTSEATQPVLGPVVPGPAGGYRLVGANGAVFTFGNAGNFGNLAGTPLNQPIVGSATTPSGNGYWMVATDGGIFAFGDAKFFGSTGGIPLNKPIVGMASTPSGNGYWLVASDGGIFAYGDAAFKGSTGSVVLNKPIVGMAATPSGQGYWLVASDGGIFAFGDATFKGSTGGTPLNKPIVGMTATPSGQGYLLVASDGGIFAFGDAAFKGSTGSTPLNKPIIGLATSPTGQGYNLVASDGGIFSFGDAGFFGSAGGTNLAAPIAASSPSNKIGGVRPIYVGWVGRISSGACPPNCEQAGELSVDSYLVVATSLNNGQTWTQSRAIAVRGFISPTGSLFAGSHFPRLATGPGGEVYMTFNAGPTQPGSSNCGAGPFPVSAPGGNGRPCPSFGTSGFKSADHFMNWDMDPWFLRSTDQGATWGNLQQLNEPKKPGLAVAELTQTRHPEMIVAPDGRIDIAWEDRRHWYLNTSDRRGATIQNTGVNATASNLGNYRCVHSHSNCDDARLGDTYYAQSTNAGLNFSFNRRVNDRSHNNDVGQDYRFSAYWDFGPALVALGNERLLIGDMDARLGNVDTDTLDIQLRKVDLNTVSGPIPTADAGSGSASALSVALSKRTYPGGGEAVHGEGFTSRPFVRPVIVNESDTSSALAAGVLARAYLAPLLASPAAGLPATVQAEVDRLDPIGAFVIGDTTKLSTTVETNLIAAGVPAAQIVRITGATPADIAANIALAMDRRRTSDKAPAAATPLPAYDAVIIANPNSASASAAANLASNRRLPILYTDQNTVPAATVSAISTLAVNKAIIVGSTGVISDAVIAGPQREIVNSSPTPAGGGTTSGSTTITSTTPFFGTGDVGQAVAGPGIPAGATIASVQSPTAATLSAPATATGPTCAVVAPATQCTPANFTVGPRTIVSGPRPVAVAGGRTTAGSTALNTFSVTGGVASPSPQFTAADVGKGITGPNIPAGTTITAVVNTAQVTLSAPATATGPDCTPVAPATTCTPASFFVAARAAGIPAGPTRLGGADQMATSSAVVAESIARGLPRNIVFTADANEPMHGALLGAFVGRIGGLMVLSTGGTAANAETALSAAPLSLRPFVDRIITSDLTGTAVVGNDPGNVPAVPAP